MKYKIGIYGSAEGADANVGEKAIALGETLSKYTKEFIVLTGAGNGIPPMIAQVFSKSGGEVWGFSACTNIDEQKKQTPEVDISIYSKFVFIPKDFPFQSDVNVSKKYRNVTSTATSDGGIIISGRWGTMNEFTNLFDMGKPIGVLMGTGGISDELPSLLQKISKKSKSKVIFNNSSEELVKGLLEELKTRFA
ncbi:hypothetical protein A3H80_03300 [Candidatus Roizmanbacteria bacterium RIFCSPLOWO2_02_FULL_37_19]|uniref:Uncharacterized protein n=1 Tax=Candidatus Roizmanbacteria bacterium RIFCSPHIGHO2_02_FULL_37_24 TaxID=1802037 RepID=A0A1F7GWY2_9BACT|nr:MAG: hypothetical protein A2862_03650 [Candidatus Roizmanbacteria bacterium RIFCSPHIGHO2_01_FULL_38_41]OGK23383.1 MAG: hypothetical protein A3C24_00050 [Candidatus Roizmanbacteria bacterium RIFCSPHIGHO2_02_FULL_37_24]OGK33191.1 MAG: hypothetical protein A3E10_05450 [Candidatus Roizmanbacteria bacterium RIFCSPHIGHO2_12_FULL_37_23]OGK43497.1 MAG: hypothetical protein A2956_02230 [Candidatus Roizmanbacteria bacterium RIFCSPLOWO2_01_FULL_37_57]OGK54627.1 MAG: hypothetical protein A3H80_03300 [Ca